MSHACGMRWPGSGRRGQILPRCHRRGCHRRGRHRRSFSGFHLQNPSGLSAGTSGLAARHGERGTWPPSALPPRSGSSFAAALRFGDKQPAASPVFRPPAGAGTPAINNRERSRGESAARTGTPWGAETHGAPVGRLGAGGRRDVSGGGIGEGGSWGGSRKGKGLHWGRNSLTDQYVLGQTGKRLWGPGGHRGDQELVMSPWSGRAAGGVLGGGGPHLRVPQAETPVGTGTGTGNWELRLGLGAGTGTGNQNWDWDQELGLGTGTGIGDRDRDQGLGPGPGTGSRTGNWELGLGLGTGMGIRNWDQELGLGLGTGNQELGLGSGTGIGTGIGEPGPGPGLGTGTRIRN